jgi:signal recognition particle receptor subunit beta
MVLFNYSTRELTAKIVYYGPGLCGKTTNLQFIYGSLPDNVKKGKMLSLATKTDRTLFFDFLPIELGTIRGMRTRVQLYTVPGQVFYNSTRKLVLKGADGVVFVADSQAKMIEANTEAYRNLEENLKEMGIRIEEIPLVMQFNKRDLPNLCSIEEMNTRINRHNAPFYEAVAMTGIGVEDTLKAITKLVLNNLSAKYRLEEAGATRPAGAAAAATVPAAPAPRRPTFDAIPSGPPEDRALDALDALDAPAPRDRRAPAHAGRPAPSPAEPEEDVIELTDEVSPGDATEPEPFHVERLPERPQPTASVTVHPAAVRSAARPATAMPRSAPVLALEPDPFDDNEPIDLEDPLEEPATPLTASAPHDVEVPLSIEVAGRTVQIRLRIQVRLSD